MTLADVPRNDIDAAVRFYLQELEAGRWNAWLGEMLMMLQDDPAALVSAMRARETQPRSTT